ncbi:MAG: T9SS type A sorting domain-containing protein [Flavobacteriales bacterium]|nr:T9SS type A sorting domain-containing protein [Flavobacteriales bacterium]
MLRLVFALLMPFALTASAQVTDTLGWQRFHEGTPLLYTSPNGGYAFGNNGYGDQVKAQSFSHSESSVLRGALIRFGAVTTTSANPQSKIRISVYANNGRGLGLFGYVDGLAPDSILAVKDIPVSDLPIDGSLFEVDLSDSNLVLIDRFSIGIDLTMIAAGDTVALLSTTDGDGGERQEAWEQDAAGDWLTVVSAFSWGLDVDLAIFALVDVNDPAGIEDLTTEMAVWPNPTDGPLSVHFPYTDQWIVTIHGVNGQLEMHQGISGDRTTLDLSCLVPGLHLLRVQGRESVMVRRIIVH